MLGTCFIGAIPCFDTNFKISNNVNSDQTPDQRILRIKQKNPSILAISIFMSILNFMLS